MSGKASEILNKLIAAGMIVASMGFFSDINHMAIYIVPGVLFGAGGFVLALRRDRRPVTELEPGLDRRLAELTENLAATRSELIATQERLDRLNDEQDFMRQLAGRPASPRIAEPLARPAEMPGAPRTPELTTPTG